MSLFSVVHQRPAAAARHPSRLLRFCRSAKGYWIGPRSGIAWLVTLSLTAVVVASLGITYELNLWNRHFYDALGAKDAAGGYWLPYVVGGCAELLGIVLAIMFIDAHALKKKG